MLVRRRAVQRPEIRVLSRAAQTAAPEPTTTPPRSLPARFHTAPMLDLGGSGAAVIVLP
jgi:hypothetical protein